MVLNGSAALMALTMCGLTDSQRLKTGALNLSEDP